MCYTGKCIAEDHYGDCTMTRNDIEILLYQVGTSQPCIEDPDNKDLISQYRRMACERAFRMLRIKQDEELRELRSQLAKAT